MFPLQEALPDYPPLANSRVSDACRKLVLVSHELVAVWLVDTDAHTPLPYLGFFISQKLRLLTFTTEIIMGES